jgi:hypothetical protein
MRLGSLICGLFLSIIYLMDFLYLQRGLESRPCREILYIRCTQCQSVRDKSPPLHARDNSTFTFFKDTFYLSMFCLQYFLLLLKSFYCQLLLLLLKYKFKVI